MKKYTVVATVITEITLDVRAENEQDAIEQAKANKCKTWETTTALSNPDINTMNVLSYGVYKI